MRTIIVISVLLIFAACEKRYDQPTPRPPDLSAQLTGSFTGTLIIQNQYVENYILEIRRMDRTNIRIVGSNEHFGPIKLSLSRKKSGRWNLIYSLDTWDTEFELEYIQEQASLAVWNAEQDVYFSGRKVN